MRGGRRAPGSPYGARGRHVWRRHAAARSPAGRGTGRAGVRGAGVAVSSSSRGPSCVTRAPRPTVGLQRQDHSSAGHRRVRVRHAAILRHREGHFHCDGHLHCDGGLDRESGVSAGRVRPVCRGGDPAAAVPWAPAPGFCPHGPPAPGVGPADGARPLCRGRGEWSSAPRRRRGWRRAPRAPAVPRHRRVTAAPIVPDNYSSTGSSA